MTGDDCLAHFDSALFPKQQVEDKQTRSERQRGVRDSSRITPEEVQAKQTTETGLWRKRQLSERRGLYIISTKTNICKNPNAGKCGPSSSARSRCKHGRSHQCNVCLGPHQALTCNMGPAPSQPSWTDKEGRESGAGPAHSSNQAPKPKLDGRYKFIKYIYLRCHLGADPIGITRNGCYTHAFIYFNVCLLLQQYSGLFSLHVWNLDTLAASQIPVHWPITHRLEMHENLYGCMPVFSEF